MRSSHAYRIATARRSGASRSNSRKARATMSALAAAQSTIALRGTRATESARSSASVSRSISAGAIRSVGAGRRFIVASGASTSTLTDDGCEQSDPHGANARCGAARSDTMSRRGVATAQRGRCDYAHCLHKLPGEPAIQQQIACGSLKNNASDFMTRCFSTAR
jgi:hypothetical protein